MKHTYQRGHGVFSAICTQRITRTSIALANRTWKTYVGTHIASSNSRQERSRLGGIQAESDFMDRTSGARIELEDSVCMCKQEMHQGSHRSRLQLARQHLQSAGRHASDYLNYLSRLETSREKHHTVATTTPTSRGPSVTHRRLPRLLIMNTKLVGGGPHTVDN